MWSAKIWALIVRLIILLLLKDKFTYLILTTFCWEFISCLWFMNFLKVIFITFCNFDLLQFCCVWILAVQNQLMYQDLRKVYIVVVVAVNVFTSAPKFCQYLNLRRTTSTSPSDFTCDFSYFSAVLSSFVPNFIEQRFWLYCIEIGTMSNF